MSIEARQQQLLKEVEATVLLRDKFIFDVLSPEEKFWRDNARKFYELCGAVQEGEWALTKTGIVLVDGSTYDNSTRWENLSVRDRLRFLLTGQKHLLTKITTKLQSLQVDYNKAIKEYSYRTTKPKPPSF